MTDSDAHAARTRKTNRPQRIDDTLKHIWIIASCAANAHHHQRHIRSRGAGTVNIATHIALP